MVTVVDNSNGSTVYVFPIATQLQYQIQVAMTSMPIPLQNIPLMLNFGGAEPTIQVQFLITPSDCWSASPQGDFIQLTQSIQWGSSTSGYTLLLPEVSTVGSTFSVQCLLTQLSLTYAQGEVNTYTGQATFAIGTVI